MKKKSFETRSLSPKNVLLIKDILGKILSFFKIDHNDAHSHWFAIKDLILYAIDNIVPIKTINPKSEVNVPWFKKDLVHLARIRDQAYHKALLVCLISNSG